MANNKGNLLAHFDLAKVYEKMGKYDLAILEYSYLSKSDDETARKTGLEGIGRLEEKRK